MRELAEREGIDLAASYAYSDSESDLPMLRAVGHPVAVNPDARAGRGSRASEGWEVLRLDRLGRRLKMAAALGGGRGAGGIGSVAVCGACARRAGVSGRTAQRGLARS